MSESASPRAAVVEAASEIERRRPAYPGLSAFVSAHAGSGKTTLLVERLLRLMLAGNDPARILCLTYTRAAAAEMAIRLQKKLGEFVAMPEVELRSTLRSYQFQATNDELAHARSLFARVLDLPGGMRIHTIHAFCQSLLTRFPLEAQVPTHFRLADELDAREGLDLAREATMEAAPPDAVAMVASLLGEGRFSSLLGEMEDARTRLAPIMALDPAGRRDALLRAAGIETDMPEAIIARAVEVPSSFAAALDQIRALCPKTLPKQVEPLSRWLALPTAARAAAWDEYLECFFTKAGAVRAASVFCHDAVAEQDPPLRKAVEDEIARIGEVLAELSAARMVRATASLLTLASPILAAHRETRTRAGTLDYNDLIDRTIALLEQPGAAAWVLFKLDGGLDHLLLDEVQDTSPQQWRIADQLTREFFAGEGARGEIVRTVFAVGDGKQSIYSFQGASPEEFDRWRRHYKKRSADIGHEFADARLTVSFRSTAPVLALVDAVFAPVEARAGLFEREPLSHGVKRQGHGGEVELWPLSPRPEAPIIEPWTVLHDNLSQTTAQARLVDALADRIADDTVRRPVELASEGRPLRPGDVIVLVRRRSSLARPLVRALKLRGVPVAGLDRMVLTDQPAIADLLSLADALLLPQDDLSVAEYLKSPLGGLDDDDLLALAERRERPLYAELLARAGERTRWRQAADFFLALLNRVDFATPFALFAEALGPLGGRARLLARFGQEAAEPIAEFLEAALAHAAEAPPSLQSFVHGLRRSGSDIKREPEAAGDAVRVMTVHGAKGLEAPWVILPDTTSPPIVKCRIAWSRDPKNDIDVPLWSENKMLRGRIVERFRAELLARQTEEERRLLYVALTRPRDKLLVCGFQPGQQLSADSWYSLISDGFSRLNATRESFTCWEGEVLRHAVSQSAPINAVSGRPGDVTAASPPVWVGASPEWRATPPSPEPALRRPLSPSRPDGIGLGPVPPSRSPLRPREEDPRRRGTLIHALLQHLPDFPAGRRQESAIRYLEPLLGAEEAASVAAAVLAILTDPALSPVFGPESRAEQRVVGVWGGQAISGQIDRLAVTPHHIWIADYKTNRLPPSQPEDTPVAYLRQMALYRGLLTAIYPRRTPRCLMIWTETASSMELPATLLEAQLPLPATA